MPDLRSLPRTVIRGHPEGVPTKPAPDNDPGVGNHLKYWIPVFTGNPGFRLEFTPYMIRGRNDDFRGYRWFMDRH